MNKFLLLGVTVVNLALLSYTLFIITLIRKKVTGKLLLTFLICGVVLDIFATSCMIAGSSNSPLTFHGLVGYSALLGMMVDLFLISRFIRYNGWKSKISKAVIIASCIYYFY